MKPILFDGSATNFNTNGLGTLTDCISCLVTEERNGVYEVEFEYPITGVRYGSITTGRIVLVSHDERKDLQPFVIYRISKPISGVVTVNAYHISYKLNNVIVKPYSATSASAALAGMKTNALNDNPFVFWTDKVSAGTFRVTVPASVRSLLGGREGSILDAFGGGEYEFDNFAVKLYAHRGNDNGVTIRYGKNLTDITADTDAEGLYNAAVPYWASEGSTTVYGGIVQGNGGIVLEETWTDENNVPIQDELGETLTFHAALQNVVPMDLSDEFDTQPTVEQLQSRAQAILNSNEPWTPKINIKVDFVALWQTEEYASIAALERVRLCDTVTVQYEALGVDATAKVIRVVWDALTERYSEIELGDAKSSFADVIMAETDERLADYPSKSYLHDAVNNATEQITGGMGGNVVLNRNANGQPIELLIMDTLDKETAINVWRWNLGGLGHSHSGYNGPFDDVAITQDGKINANMITVGTMYADRIRGGNLELGGTTDGSMTVLDSNGNTLVTADTNGLTITGGSINLGNGLFRVTNAGKLTATDATITGAITATSGGIGGFDITETAIKTKNVAITSNATNSIGLSSVNFTRTVAGESRTDLRFAIGSHFGVSGSGVLYANSVDLTGKITATSGGIGGFDITSTAIKTKDVAITSNAANSIGFSSADFTRTINGTSRSGLRFAIGSNFGVTGSGVLYAGSVNLSGTITAADSTRSTVLTSGYSRYYYGDTHIGEIGASVANGDNGLVFDLKNDGDYIGWFLGGTSNPILIYDKQSWLGKDIQEECLNVCCDLWMTSGNYMCGGISDPSWRFDGTTYAGYNGTVTINNVRMTFHNGILTSSM